MTHRHSDDVRAVLTDDLLSPQYAASRRRWSAPTAGHCYAASEALYHLLGGRAAGLKPEHVVHEGESHWYLRDTVTGLVIDPTADQFDTAPDYERGRGKGFLTREPSGRARTIIARVNARRG